ncbi:MAG: response regulator [Pseudomonadales bacterium]
MAHDRSYLTPVEVANLLMVSTASVRSWSAKGLLEATTTAGGHRRFLRSTVEDFAQNRGIDIPKKTSEGLRILVVDDDNQLRGYLFELLDGMPGVEAVSVARDGFETGQQVEIFKPNVVLLDLMMPGLNGFEVCARLQSCPEHEGIRVIAMTGYNNEENITKIMDAGATHCLAKPLDRKQLFSVLGISFHS